MVSCQRDVITSDIAEEYELMKLIGNGGRVSWYQGDAHSKVLFDRITEALTGNTAVYIMEPDGTNIECITCDIEELQDKFVGQPIWHPDGIHCVIQAENENSSHTRFEHVSFGLNNDLWIVNTQNLSAEKLFSTELNDGTLHPQFNRTGDKLIFSRRISTGVSFPDLEGITPGGENHWDGWQIQINEFDINLVGLNKITGFELIKPNGNGFYETHSIDERLIYSYTPNGWGYVDDCYSSNLQGDDVINLIQSVDTWEEHATYSPSKENFIFISSRHDSEWSYPDEDTRTINTELYIKNEASQIIDQLTNFNATQDDFRVLTSDFDWSSDGESVIFLVAKIHKTNILLTENEIWKIQFDEEK